MGSLTVMDLRATKGKRTIAYVEVAREEEAIAAAASGMDMIGTAFVPDRAHWARAVPACIFNSACCGANTPMRPRHCATP